jgi:alpha,alpha-trehalase
VEGTYPLANLLEQLAIAHKRGRPTTVIGIRQLYQPPPSRVTRMIRHYDWDWLTRSLGPEGLHHLMQDTEVDGTGPPRIYVPHDDPRARSYYHRLAEEFPDLGLQVIELPEHITPAYVRSLDDKPGILSLALGRKGVGYILPERPEGCCAQNVPDPFSAPAAPVG